MSFDWMVHNWPFFRKIGKKVLKWIPDLKMHLLPKKTSCSALTLLRNQGEGAFDKYLYIFQICGCNFRIVKMKGSKRIFQQICGCKTTFLKISGCSYTSNQFLGTHNAHTRYDSATEVGSDNNYNLYFFKIHSKEDSFMACWT